MSSEPLSAEPTVVIGPLAFVALLTLWRGVRRRNLLAVGVGIAATAAEFGWSDYRRLMRRWTRPSTIDG